MLLVILDRMHDSLEKVLDLLVDFIYFASVPLFYQHVAAEMTHDTDLRLRVPLARLNQVLFTIVPVFVFLLRVLELLF